ncbi:glycosyltransferase [Herbiconiux sp. CPCC 205763]|uniref:Glycosyltransferase n=1 Tax=Herbiconiux aconitum TaxID=2970913 RepID=A0ABT2GK75_9MICO|nr:glycosyltransferase [Herbiconiux aconitum]MCS5716622.1 glycosyltransferase [Herbiconiux aconitum]
MSGLPRRAAALALRRLRRRWSLATGRPRLQWAIKISAPEGSTGDVWGDVYFAHDLAVSLRALGQRVRIDRLGQHGRTGGRFSDDVVIHLVGLHDPVPQDGAVNLIWVISHPELVTDQVLGRRWNGRYAASLSWAAEHSAPDRAVAGLLQATDPHRFAPDGPRDADLEADVLFVGKTREVYRPIVRDAIEAGADLQIYGDGWEAFIDPRYVRADFLANERVPAAYRSARIVLNDHWADMADEGFVSNRLFDAVAVGARVVSDDVSGLPEEFGSSVQVYRSPDELHALLDPAATVWPDAAARRRAAGAVAQAHSFDARARRLLRDVLVARASRHRARRDT